MALAVVVGLLHLWFAATALPPRLGTGADRRPTRIAVRFSQELKPTAPPAAPPRPQGTAPRRLQSAALARAALPASAAGPMTAPALQADVDGGLVADLAAALPQPALPPEGLATAAPAASGANPALEWPPSTRLAYRLTGNYRGPVEGQAQVEWLRQGERYQVFMDLSVGPGFAPLISRRVSSEGLIGADGLHPQRYDERTTAVFNAPRSLHIDLDADRIRLPNREAVARPPGVQDSASQFVQLTWIFTTRPDLLRAGNHVTIPLALPRRVEPWIYDVLETETLSTPAGPVDAVHLKPRREARPGRDLTAEVWVAPSLQYLPVRILIRHDAETFVDLVIDRLPQQAMPAVEATAPSASSPPR